MTQTRVSDVAGSSQPVRRRKLGVPIVLQLLAMVGIGALVYPYAADWVSTLGHNAERSGYVRAVADLPAESRQAGLDEARDYNASLPAGLLLDPYSGSGDTAEQPDENSYRAYEEVLRVAGSAVIGEVSYPRLNIGLPLYPEAGEAAISRGVGHLYGSSLPVGGPSTHAVLTSHSGLIHASLFSQLPSAAVGDRFEIRVLGESLFYEVDRIETVEPFVTESLRVAEGEDRVTLFTCTPIGVNSHRLLVSGVRVDPPSGADRAIGGDGLTAGFPWWTLAFVGGSGLVAAMLFAPRQPHPARRGNDAGNSGGAPWPSG
ncbi:class C sortase [Leucobacter sp. BZR 635]